MQVLHAIASASARHPIMSGFFVLLVVGLSLQPAKPDRSVDQALSPAERYPGPWIDEVDVSIARALVRHRIRGCGYFFYRAHYLNSAPHDPAGEYLVYCSNNLKDWTASVVKPASGSVIGPTSPYEEIPPPL
jgi:hypothetical protein